MVGPPSSLQRSVTFAVRAFRLPSLWLPVPLRDPPVHDARSGRVASAGLARSGSLCTNAHGRYPWHGFLLSRTACR